MQNGKTGKTTSARRFSVRFTPYFIAPARSANIPNLASIPILQILIPHKLPKSIRPNPAESVQKKFALSHQHAQALRAHSCPRQTIHHQSSSCSIVPDRRWGNNCLPQRIASPPTFAFSIGNRQSPIGNRNLNPQVLPPLSQSSLTMNILPCP